MSDGLNLAHSLVRAHTAVAVNWLRGTAALTGQRRVHRPAPTTNPPPGVVTAARTSTGEERGIVIEPIRAIVDETTASVLDVSVRQSPRFVTM